MLTPDYLDGLPEPIVKILQNVEDFMIGDIARRMRKVGDATSTAEIQRIALQTMGESTKAINAKIAEAMGMTQKEVAQIFAQSEQVVTDNQAQIFEAVGIKQDLGFAKRIGQAAVQSAMGDLSNLTRTMGYPTNSGQFTLWTDAYRQALGFAQMQVATGAIDYNTAIRQAIKPFTARGLCSVNYASGRVVSIEAAARQCIIGGVSDMANAIGEKNAKDFGADGWEISAHGDCAPDHEAAQGRQYSNKEYEALNSLLARPIGTLGCRHSAYPILMGISGRAYSDARLAEMKRKNAEGITYEGRHYTGYEATQMQRQIERSIRKTKRELIGADKAGLKDDFMTSSIKLR
ncbi:MAG: phage minor capsid protein, partial [Christensenella sp.]